MRKGTSIIRRAGLGLVVVCLVAVAAPVHAGFSLSGYDLQVVQSGQGLDNAAASLLTIRPWDVSGRDQVVDTSFVLPSFQTVAYSRLYLDIWGGTRDYTAQVTATFNGVSLGVMAVGGTANTGTTYDGNATCVYGSGFGVWQVAYGDLAALIHTDGAANELSFVITDPTGNFDGRVYGATLVTVYTDPSIPGSLDYYLAEADGALRKDPGSVGSPAERTVAFTGLNVADVVSAQYTAVYTHGDRGQTDQIFFNGTPLGGASNDVAIAGMGLYGPDVVTFDVTALLADDSVVRYSVNQGELGGVAETSLRANIGLLTVTHIPEPATVALLAMGLAGLAGARKRRP